MAEQYTVVLPGNIEPHFNTRLERDAFVEWKDNLQRDLNNLLAIIHRDGGHHTGEVGTEQSVEDAHQVWGELVLRIAELTLALVAERERIKTLEADNVAHRKNWEASAIAAERAGHALAAEREKSADYASRLQATAESWRELSIKRDELVLHIADLERDLAAERRAKP